MSAGEAFAFLGVAILAGMVGKWAFQRFRVSDILVLLIFGFLLGPLLGLLDASWLTPAMPILAPLGLVIILFEGGLELRWEEIRKYGGGALLFSGLSWATGAVALFVVAWLVLGLSIPLAALFAVAVCATGIVAVIPMLAQVRAPAKPRVWLTAETSLGDLLSVVAVTGLAGLLLHGGNGWSFGSSLAAEVLLGGAMGFLGGVAWSRALFHVGSRSRAHAYALTLGALLLAYAGTEALGGSGYLSALVFGLVVGNAPALMRDGGLPALASLGERSREHQAELIFLLRSVYFVYLGLSLDRSIVSAASGYAMLAMVAAVLVARVLTVRLAHRGNDVDTRRLLTGMMPRGMATMVLAATPAAMGVPGSEALIPLALLLVVGADIATTLGVWRYERRRKRADAQAPAAATA